MLKIKDNKKSFLSANQEHDIYKSMFKRINEIKDIERNDLIKINEDNENNQANEIIITDDPKFGQNTLSSQKNELVSGLGSNINFGDKPLVYNKTNKDITFSGEIVDIDNLRFRFNLNNSSNGGCRIWVTNENGLLLNEDNMRKIQKLTQLYENWRENWIGNGELYKDLQTM